MPSTLKNQIEEIQRKIDTGVHVGKEADDAREEIGSLGLSAVMEDLFGDDGDPDGGEGKFATVAKPPRLIVRKAHPGYGASSAYYRTEEPIPRLIVVKAGNPNHGPDGRFTSAGGGGYLHATTRGADGKLTMADGSPLPAHIAALRIPPAWKDVEINKDPKGGLLAQGKAANGKTQPIYSEEFAGRGAASKFARNTELLSKDSAVASQIESNLKSSDPKTRENAAALKLIYHTGLRPGGGESDNYGATTLEGRHVVINGKKATLNFVGKSNKKNSIPVDDPSTVMMLLERKEAAGKTGKIFNTNESSLSEYTHTLGGGGFKTKDMRTLVGTKEAIAVVSKMAVPKGEAAYKKAVKEVATLVAKKLGNTPTVALQSYINPIVFAHWRNQ